MHKDSPQSRIAPDKYTGALGVALHFMHGLEQNEFSHAQHFVILLLASKLGLVDQISIFFLTLPHGFSWCYFANGCRCMRRLCRRKGSDSESFLACGRQGDRTCSRPVGRSRRAAVPRQHLFFGILFCCHRKHFPLPIIERLQKFPFSMRSLAYEPCWRLDEGPNNQTIWSRS